VIGPCASRMRMLNAAALKRFWDLIPLDDPSGGKKDRRALARTLESSITLRRPRSRQRRWSRRHEI
jgi:hypothetical protein